MEMRVQVQAAVDQILGEAEVADLPLEQLDIDILARCCRAAYALGYQHALQQEQPWPLTEASRAERESWAKLPVA